MVVDSVNVASRLEGLTKVYGVSTNVSATAVNALRDRSEYCLRVLGDVEIRGHQHAASAFELFDGDPHELALHKRRTLACFEPAFDVYRNGKHAQSRQLFADIAALDPLDRAAAFLRDQSTRSQAVDKL